MSRETGDRGGGSGKAWDERRGEPVWAHTVEQAELKSRPGGRRQRLTPGSVGSETRGSFAARYEPRDPGVSAPGKPWIKSRYRPSGLTIELAELSSRPGGRKQFLTPASVGAKTPGSWLIDINYDIL